MYLLIHYLLGFLDYIRNTWLHGIYPLRLWNVHDAGRIKTNNNIEGWHRFLKELFGKHMNLWKFIAKLHTCQKKEEYYLDIIRHGQPNAVHERPKKAYQLKENQLILIIANYQRGVYDSKADFLQAIAETQGAAFIDELPEDNHYLVNEGINDSEYEDSEQPSSDSEDE